MTCDKTEFSIVQNLLSDEISSSRHLYIQGEFKGDEIQFRYSMDNVSFFDLGAAVNGGILSDEYVRDEKNYYRPAFTGSFVGICCQDLTGQLAAADFKFFHYNDLKKQATVDIKEFVQ